MDRRNFSAAVAAIGLGVVAAGRASAQGYPDRSVRLVVAYPAGGGVDFVARLLARRIGELTQQTVVVENRSGVSGALGADMVAKSRPDGYTLLLASPGEVIVGPAAGQKTPYDPSKDFVPVALAGETPLALAIHPSVPASDLTQWLTHAKASDQASYGTPGAGSSMHFAGKSINQLAGTSILHVPYRGAAPAVNDLLGNQVPSVIVGMPPLVAHAKNGRVRLLAVTTARRSSAMPEVPAVAELPGMAGFHFSNWMGLFAPAGTPAAVVDRLGALIARIVQEPAVRGQLTSAGVEPAGLVGSALADFLTSERARYQSIAKTRGVRFAE